jgi:hypothetical protein
MLHHLIFYQPQPPEAQIVVVYVTVCNTTGSIVALVVLPPSFGSAMVGIEEGEPIVEF